MYIFNVYNDYVKNYIFYSFLLIFFPKESENVPFKKDDNDSDDEKKNAVILLDSYFQVIYNLSKFFLMIIPWVRYPFSDKRMKVLGSWVLSPRSYKKKKKLQRVYLNTGCLCYSHYSMSVLHCSSL